MKLEELPPELRDAATSMQKLAGDAYTKARENFLASLAKHTGDVDKAKKQAEDLLEQARHKSAGFFDQARAKSEELLKQAEAKSQDLLNKAKDKLRQK